MVRTFPPLEPGDVGSADGLTENLQGLDYWTWGNWSGYQRLYTVRSGVWDAFWRPAAEDWGDRGTPNDFGPAEAMRINDGPTRPLPPSRNQTIEFDGNNPSRVPTLLFTGLQLSLAKPPNSITNTIDCSSAISVTFSIAARNDHIGTSFNNLTGYGRIRLYDSVGNIATHEFSYVPDLKATETLYALQSRTLPMFEFVTTDYLGNPTTQFDWTHIHNLILILDLDFNPNNALSYGGYTAWLDGGPYFTFTDTPSRIWVKCENEAGASITGKHAEVVLPAGGAPTPVNLPWGPVTGNPGDYSVKALDSDFVKWKSDGSNNTTKVITVPLGGLGTDTAVFVSGQPPPSSNWLLPVVIAGIAIGGIYLLMKGGA